MARYEVIAIKTELSPGRTHRHIGTIYVRGDYSSTTEPVRKEVAAVQIRLGLREYYTNAGGVRADVEVVRCSGCDANDYLRTDPDKTKDNNLLSLPDLAEAA